MHFTLYKGKMKNANKWPSKDIQLVTSKIRIDHSLPKFLATNLTLGELCGHGMEEIYQNATTRKLLAKVTQHIGIFLDHGIHGQMLGNVFAVIAFGLGDDLSTKLKFTLAFVHTVACIQCPLNEVWQSGHFLFHYTVDDGPFPSLKQRTKVRITKIVLAPGPTNKIHIQNFNLVTIHL